MTHSSNTNGPYRDIIYRRIGRTVGNFTNTYIITSVVYSNVKVYDYDSPSTVVIDDNVRDINPFPDDGDEPFVPDDGEGPSEGGGNQNWGQGNPTISTEGGNFDNTSDIIGTGTSTSFKAVL